MTHLLTDDTHPPRSVSRARKAGMYRLRVSKADTRASNEPGTFVELLRLVLDRDFGGADSRGAKSAFAKAAGIHVGQVGRFLNGQPPRTITLRKMAPLMGVPWHRLEDMANAQGDNDTDTLDDSAHPYAVQVNQLLTEGKSDIPDGERESLGQVLNTVLTPYRKHLRRRKAA